MTEGRRRSICLPGYDYAYAGWYFVTICCKDRAQLFGEIRDGDMVLTEVVRVTMECWLETEAIRSNCRNPEYIIRPIHIQGEVECTVGAENSLPHNRAPINYKKRFTGIAQL